jgi:hypothetical protein
MNKAKSNAKAAEILTSLGVVGEEAAADKEFLVKLLAIAPDEVTVTVTATEVSVVFTASKEVGLSIDAPAGWRVHGYDGKVDATKAIVTPSAASEAVPPAAAPSAPWAPTASPARQETDWKDFLPGKKTAIFAAGVAIGAGAFYVYTSGMLSDKTEAAPAV